MNTALPGASALVPTQRSFSLLSLSYINFFLSRTSPILCLAFEGFLVWYQAKTNLDLKNIISDASAYGQGKCCPQGRSSDPYFIQQNPIACSPGAVHMEIHLHAEVCKMPFSCRIGPQIPTPSSRKATSHQKFGLLTSGSSQKNQTIAKAPHCSLHFLLRASTTNTLNLHIKYFFRFVELNKASTGFFFQTNLTSNDRDLEAGVVSGSLDGGAVLLWWQMPSDVAPTVGAM